MALRVRGVSKKWRNREKLEERTRKTYKWSCISRHVFHLSQMTASSGLHYLVSLLGLKSQTPFSGNGRNAILD